MIFKLLIKLVVENHRFHANNRINAIIEPSVGFRLLISKKDKKKIDNKRIEKKFG